MKHTPGPWALSAPKISQGHGLIGFYIQPGGDRPWLWLGDVNGEHLGIPTDEILGNALLMMAGPVMLEALQEAAAMLDVAEFPEGAATVARVRDAIRTATVPSESIRAAMDAWQAAAEQRAREREAAERDEYERLRAKFEQRAAA